MFCALVCCSLAAFHKPIFQKRQLEPKEAMSPTLVSSSEIEPGLEPRHSGYKRLCYHSIYHAQINVSSRAQGKSQNSYIDFGQRRNCSCIREERVVIPNSGQLCSFTTRFIGPNVKDPPSVGFEKKLAFLFKRYTSDSDFTGRVSITNVGREIQRVKYKP